MSWCGFRRSSPGVRAGVVPGPRGTAQQPVTSRVSSCSCKLDHLLPLVPPIVPQPRRYGNHVSPHSPAHVASARYRADMTDTPTALDHLQHMLGPGATFRPGQLEAIEAVARDRGRVLLVQRTGWGKSAVYFIATKLLREQGAGPTLLVSPAARADAQPDRDGRAHRRARRDDQLHEPRRVRADRRAPGERRDRPAAGLARAARERAVPRPHAVGDRAHGRPARGRRGALHQRLGPRLPARLPAHRARARGAAGRRARALHHRDRERPGDRRHHRPARRRAADVPRPARPREPGAARSPTCRARPSAWPGWLQTLPGLDGSGIVYCSRSPTANGWPRSCAGRASTPRPTAAPPTTTTASGSSRRCSRTSSRRSWRRARSAWGSTSPTWASWSTTSRRARRSPTTSRSGAPDAPSTTRRRCCCAASRIARSRTTSSRRPSRRGSRPSASSSCWPTRAEPMSLNDLMAAVNVRRARLESMLKVLEVEGAVARERGGYVRTADAVDVPGRARRAHHRAAPPRAGGDAPLRPPRRLPDGVPAPRARRPGRGAVRALHVVHVDAVAWSTRRPSCEPPRASICGASTCSWSRASSGRRGWRRSACRRGGSPRTSARWPAGRSRSSATAAGEGSSRRAAARTSTSPTSWSRRARR